MAIVNSALYQPAPPPADPSDPLYLQNELRRIKQAFTALELRGPKEAVEAPVRPQAGWIRLARSPWDPLGTGPDVMVYFDGASWQPL